MRERHRHHKNALSPTHSLTESSPGQSAISVVNQSHSLRQTQLNSSSDIENEAFQDDKHEAFGLQLQAKYGAITPEGQERLTVLQAKMDAFRKSETRQHRPNLLQIPNLLTPRTQTKLAIGQPGDKYEQEADSVAEQVMRMSDVNKEEELQMKPLAGAITPLVQRQCAECEEEAVQRKDGGSLQMSGDIESQLNSSKGGGSALPDDVRAFMEPRIGHDFSAVRVHTDSAAVQMNRELSAQAFTHGSDVYYGAGKSPGRDALTAHELTHVVQQTGAVQRQQKDSRGAATTTPPSPKTKKTIDASTGSVSWIDPASPAGKGPLGVNDPAPPATINESFITGSSAFRFSNYLHGSLTTNDSVTVDSFELYGNSGIYRAPSFAGLESEAYSPVRKEKRINISGIEGVEFEQIVGARTVSPAKVGGGIGATVGVGTGALAGAKLGALGGSLFGPAGTAIGGVGGALVGGVAGYFTGTATANKVFNFPPIWTNVKLRIMADGTQDCQLLQHSLFPSNSFYCNFARTSTYSALAPQQTAWENSGWGSGNPWGKTRPTFTN